jgi:copper resistance protein D
MASLFLFEAAIMSPATRKSSAATGYLLDKIHWHICRTAFWTLLATLLSWFVWSWLVASTMTGEELMECLQNGDWWTVLATTQFGHIWLFRLLINLIIGIILWRLDRRFGRRNALQKTLTGLSLMELVSLAGVGHASAGLSPFGPVQLLGDALHLLASAFWPGALVPLAAFLLLLLKTNGPEFIGLAIAVVRRFSASSLMAVAGIALTGLVNSFFMVGSVQALLTTSYGQILISKLLLFSGMIGFGTWNLFWLKPKIAIDLSTVDFVGQTNALRLLLRNVLLEIGLGTLVILIVGLLGITTPPLR